MLLSIPSLLLAIIVVAFVGTVLVHAMIAIWLALLPRLVRMIYSAGNDELNKGMLLFRLMVHQTFPFYGTPYCLISSCIGF